jgi:hypothetical protein
MCATTFCAREAGPHENVLTMTMSMPAERDDDDDEMARATMVVVSEIHVMAIPKKCINYHQRLARRGFRHRRIPMMMMMMVVVVVMEMRAGGGERRGYKVTRVISKIITVMVV